jgi:hypothetical protein
MHRDPKSRYENALLIAQELNSFLYKKQVANDATTVANYLRNPKNFAQELRNTSIRVRFERAKAFKEKDMVFEALQEYEAVLQEDPGNKDVQEEIARLVDVKLSRSKTGIDMQTMVVPRTPKRNKVLLLAALIALLLAGVGILRWGGGKPAPTPPSSGWKDSLLASMRDSMLYSMNAQIASAVTPLADTAPHKIEIPEAGPRAEKPQRTSGPKEDVPVPALAVPAAEAVADSPAAAPEPCMGHLFIFSELWGAIYLNDKKIGDAPTKQKIPVPCGDYQMRIENPGGKGFSTAITVAGGEIVKRTVKESDFK